MTRETSRKATQREKTRSSSEDKDDGIEIVVARNGIGTISTKYECFNECNNYEININILRV